jgi:hypothetical protein
VAVPEAWAPLADPAVHARALRVARDDIAYFKYLFESYEGVAIVRTVETIDRYTAIIAVLATADFVAEAEAILRDVAAAGQPPLESVALPPTCTEDWFLAAWTRAEATPPQPVGRAKK